MLAASLRTLLRQPRFALATICLLGGTLFAVALVVSLIAAVVVRPLPFDQAEQLVAVRATVLRDGVERRAFSRPDFLDYQSQARSFEAFGAYSPASATLRDSSGPLAIAAELVDPHYFAALRTKPQLGRLLEVDEAREPLVFISDRLWRDRYGADPSVIGRGVQVDALSLAIGGVLPRGFNGLSDADAWYSFDIPGAVTPETAAARGQRWHEAIARLEPGVDATRANEDLAEIGRRLDEAYPGTNLGNSADVVPLRTELLGNQRGAVTAAAGGVAVLLLIAVMNLGGLALVRATSRNLEQAVRRCLGASASRLLAGASVEGAIVGVLASMLALAAAWLLLGHFRDALPLGLPSFASTDLTAGVALSVAAAGILGGMLAFVGGALAARDRNLEGLRGGARSTRRGGFLRRTLVGGEIALGTALLAIALMLARSFAAIDSLDPGYRVEDIAVLDFELPTNRYEPAAALVFGERMLDAARTTPGVVAAALSADTPLSNNESATIITSDQLEGTPTRVYRHVVTRDYFGATGIALVEGDTFAASEPVVAEPSRVIVSQALARRLFGESSPIGRKLKRGDAGAETPWLTIVGVAADARWRGIPSAPTADPDLFLPLEESPRTAFSLTIRTSDDPRATATRVAERVESLDADVPLYDVETMAERVARATQVPRFLARLGLAFSAVALLLAGLGIYAIAALEGAQRVRELAIRQAVGANAKSLAKLFVGDYSRVFAIAAVVGLLAVAPAGAALESRLFGVGTIDPGSLAGAIAAFGAALAIGVAAPLRRVLRVEPGLLMRGD